MFRLPLQQMNKLGAHRMSTPVVRFSRPFARARQMTVSKGKTAWAELAPGLTPFQKSAAALAGTASFVCIGTIAFAGQTNMFADAIGVAEYTPEYAYQRIRATYGYVTAGLGMTAATSVALFRTGAAQRILTVNPMMFMGVSLVGTIGTMLLTMATDYEEQPLLKHVAWFGFNTMMATSLCTVGFLGGPIILKAAVGTGLMVGSLSLVAANSPSEKFLWMGGPLTVGLGVVMISSVGTLFFPGSALLQNVVLYGGLGLFGAMVLYDTNKIRLAAMHTPPGHVYDPINNSISVYLDTINIFIRLAQILSLQKKK